MVPAERLTPLTTSTLELVGYLNEAFMVAKDAATGSKDSGAADQDLLGVLAAASLAGELADEVAVLILVQLVGAGGESTAGLIANAARMLATRPELQTLLRERPHLIPTFLDEALRLESPFRGHHRHVVRDTELGGVPLEAGSHLLLLWGAANRDPAVFPNPDALDLERPTGRMQMAFGKGVHFCIGSALAKLEAQAAIETLLDRTTGFALIDDAPPRWVPSLFVRRHASLPLRMW